MLDRFGLHGRWGGHDAAGGGGSGRWWRFISFGFDCVDVDVDFGELASAVVVVSRIPDPGSFGFRGVDVSYCIWIVCVD